MSADSPNKLTQLPEAQHVLLDQWGFKTQQHFGNLATNVDTSNLKKQAWLEYQKSNQEPSPIANIGVYGPADHKIRHTEGDMTSGPESYRIFEASQNESNGALSKSIDMKEAAMINAASACGSTAI